MVVRKRANRNAFAAGIIGLRRKVLFQIKGVAFFRYTDMDFCDKSFIMPLPGPPKGILTNPFFRHGYIKIDGIYVIAYFLFSPQPQFIVFIPIGTINVWLNHVILFMRESKIY